MGSVILLFFIQNVFIFSLIFWLLSWLTEWFYQEKDYAARSQHYECGFKALSEVNFQVNIQFSILCVFLILYDVEFTFIYPLCFNAQFMSPDVFYTFLIFISFILLALYFDYAHNAVQISL